MAREKPLTPIRVKQWQVIDVHDLEDSAREHYGHKLDWAKAMKITFPGHNTMVNNSTWGVTVPGQCSTQTREIFEAWTEGRTLECSLIPLLNALHERGLIKAGDYRLHVWF